MTAQQTVSIEWDEHEIYMTFTAEMVWDDYGVPRSPRWLTPTNIKWEDYEFDGESLTEKQLEEKLGKEAVSKIDDLLLEAIDDDNWEEEEPDYYDDDERVCDEV